MTIEALLFGANVVLLVANLAMLSAKIIIGALDDEDENERDEDDESQNTP